MALDLNGLILKSVTLADLKKWAGDTLAKNDRDSAALVKWNLGVAKEQAPEEKEDAKVWALFPRDVAKGGATVTDLMQRADAALVDKAKPAADDETLAADEEIGPDGKKRKKAQPGKPAEGDAAPADKNKTEKGDFHWSEDLSAEVRAEQKR